MGDGVCGVARPEREREEKRDRSREEEILYACVGSDICVGSEVRKREVSAATSEVMCGCCEKCRRKKMGVSTSDMGIGCLFVWVLYPGSG